MRTISFKYVAKSWEFKKMDQIETWIKIEGIIFFTALKAYKTFSQTLSFDRQHYMIILTKTAFPIL